MPETFVSFRLSAPELDPDAITATLGLTPSSAHRQGEYPQGNSKFSPYRKGHWSLDSSLSRDQQIESHILLLLDLLEPKLDVIRDLSQRVEIDFYATIFDQNGIQLSAQTIIRIAQLQVGLGVTVYPGPDRVYPGRPNIDAAA